VNEVDRPTPHDMLASWEIGCKLLVLYHDQVLTLSPY